jgi:hypothetical protein
MWHIRTVIFEEIPMPLILALACAAYIWLPLLLSPAGQAYGCLHSSLACDIWLHTRVGWGDLLLPLAVYLIACAVSAATRRRKRA